MAIITKSERAMLDQIKESSGEEAAQSVENLILLTKKINRKGNK